MRRKVSKGIEDKCWLMQVLFKRGHRKRNVNMRQGDADLDPHISFLKE